MAATKQADRTVTAWSKWRKKHEAEKLLRQGLIPSEIAKLLGISIGSTIQYLHTRIGEGALRLSEIYFCLSPERREVLREVSRIKRRNFSDKTIGLVNGLTSEDYEFYKPIRVRTVFAGDLYEHLSETELAIYDLVVNTLKQTFGYEENGHWRKGVPVSIRIKCQGRREEDEDPSESPLQYTTLIELSQIISANWKLFQDKLPKQYSSDQTLLKKDFLRLNGIRNTVTHPVKRRHWTESDFQFAAQLHAALKHYRMT